MSTAIIIAASFGIGYMVRSWMLRTQVAKLEIMWKAIQARTKKLNEIEAEARELRELINARRPNC